MAGLQAVTDPALNATETVKGREASTPNQAFKNARDMPGAQVIKDPGAKVDKGFVEAVYGSGGVSSGKKGDEQTTTPATPTPTPETTEES